MQSLEEGLLHDNHQEAPEQLESRLSQNFEEVSASGHRSQRSAVIQWLLRKDPQARWQLRELQVRELGPLSRWVHYHARQVAPVVSTSQGAWHSSLWCRPEVAADWQLCFHQATRLSG